MNGFGAVAICGVWLSGGLISMTCKDRKDTLCLVLGMLAATILIISVH